MSEKGRRPARVVGLFIVAICLVGLGRLGSATDAATLLVVTAACTTLAWALCALGAAWLRRPPSIRAHIFISTASAAMATATGGWLVARWLFDWEEDIPLLAAVVFLVVGAKGMLAALSLSKQLEQASGSLIAAAKRISPEDGADVHLEQNSLEVNQLASQVDMLRESSRSCVPGSEASRSQDGSSSPGCHTTSVRPSPPCGRWPRHSRMGSSRRRRRLPNTTGGSSRRSTESRSWSTTSSS